MKQNRHRLGLGLAAIGAVAALTLSGCSGDAGESETTLTIWHYYNADGQVEGLQHMAEAFEAKHPDVKVEFSYVPVDQFTTKAITAAGAGTRTLEMSADGACERGPLRLPCRVLRCRRTRVAPRRSIPSSPASP